MKACGEIIFARPTKALRRSVGKENAAAPAA